MLFESGGSSSSPSFDDDASQVFDFSATKKNHQKTRKEKNGNESEREIKWRGEARRGAIFLLNKKERENEGVKR